MDCTRSKYTIVYNYCFNAKIWQDAELAALVGSPDTFKHYDVAVKYDENSTTSHS
jgi:hypothetical protein